MKLLLDTGAWLRGIVEPESVPAHVRPLLAAKGEIFGLSAISIWEIGKKHQIGKLSLKKELGTWLHEALTSNIEILPLTVAIVTDAMSLPDFPNRDPANELIVATARVHGLTLLTSDTALKRYRHAAIQYFAPLHVPP